MRWGIVFMLAAAVAAAQSVSVQNGNVLLKDRDGFPHRITDSGRDSEASLSADGRRIVFLRSVREAAGIGVPRVAVNEIWTAPAKWPATPKRLFAGTVTAPDGRSLEAFTTPRLSPDGRHVYFLADFAATSFALCKLDAAKGTARFLGSVIRYDVIPSGPRKGFLVAVVRSASDSSYPYVLLTPEGKEERRVAGPEARMEDVVNSLLQ